MRASYSWPNYMPTPHLKTLLLLWLGHHNIDFRGTQTFNLKHPPHVDFCWMWTLHSCLLESTEIKERMVCTDPHISLILIKVHPWCTLFCLQNGCWYHCYASLHCSVPCSSPRSPLFPLKSPILLPLLNSTDSALSVFFFFPFWSILDFVTSYIFYFYKLNFCFIFILKTYFDTISILNPL